jgi:hypothetical protein
MCLHYSQNLMTTTWGDPFSSNVSNARELNFFQLSSATHKLIEVSLVLTPRGHFRPFGKRVVSTPRKGRFHSKGSFHSMEGSK